MNGWEETVDQILVQGLILAHFVDGVPLRGRHALLDGLGSDVLALEIVTAHPLVGRLSCARLKLKNLFNTIQ